MVEVPRGPDHVTLRFGTVERIAAPSVEVFRGDFEQPRRPVVITGAMRGWSAIERWTPEHFASVHGNVRVGVRSSSIGARQVFDGDPLAAFETQTMPFAECVRQIADPAPPSILYLQHCDVQRTLPGLAADIERPPYCPGSLVSAAQVWVCGAGAINPLHFDFNHVLLAQVTSTKRFVLFPPSDSHLIAEPVDRRVWRTTGLDLSAIDHRRFPRLSEASPIECTVEVGEMLFIPYRWWHGMSTEAFSVSVTWWWEPDIWTRVRDAVRWNLSTPAKMALRALRRRSVRAT